MVNKELGVSAKAPHCLSSEDGVMVNAIEYHIIETKFGFHAERNCKRVSGNFIVRQALISALEKLA